MQYAAPNKGITILYWFRPQTLLNPLANGKIQGLFNAFGCFSSTFQGKFIFQGLFKTVLYIQVLFKPVRTLCTHLHTYSKHMSKFLVCISTGLGEYIGESHKLEVQKSGGLISKYRKLELQRGRHKIYYPKKWSLSIFICIKHTFWVFKRNVSRRRFFYASKTYVIIDRY